MKRKLLSVAVAGVFAAPAMALAQASTVQLYGKLDVEYGYVDQGSGRPNTDMLQTPNGSAIGFRGEEKLGGGLSAWFQCESSADVRGVSQNGFCSRNSAVGFKHNLFGNIHIGRWDTPFKRALNVGLAGATDSGLMGTVVLMAGASTGTGATGGQGASQSLSRNIWKRRESSQIYYESPTFKGFQALASYSSANATAVTDGTLGAKPRVQSLAGTYTNGPLQVGIGYERHVNFGATKGENTDAGWTLGGSYKLPNFGFGGVKLAAQYINTRYEMADAPLTKENWMVGLDWNISGPHNFEASFVNAGNSKGNSKLNTGLTGGNGRIEAPGSGTGAQQINLTYRHVLSKRTSVRLGYVHLNNDNNARYSLGGLATPTKTDTNQNAVVMHVQHSF